MTPLGEPQKTRLIVTTRIGGVTEDDVRLVCNTCSMHSFEDQVSLDAVHAHRQMPGLQVSLAQQDGNQVDS